MLRAPGDARNRTIAAMSSGSLARCSGMASARRRSMASNVSPSCWARTRRLASERAVRVTPGQMALTLIVVLGELLGRRLRQADDGSLAGGIGSIRRARVTFAGNRGDVDDA